MDGWMGWVTGEDLFFGISNKNHQGLLRRAWSPRFLKARNGIEHFPNPGNHGNLCSRRLKVEIHSPANATSIRIVMYGPLLALITQ